MEFEKMILELFKLILGWPFLLFVGVGILLFKFKTEIGQLIERGGISIVWGDKSFSIKELPNQLDENFAPLVDDVADLKEMIANHEKLIQKISGEKLGFVSGVMDKSVNPLQGESLSDEQIAQARDRMLDALDEGNYRWRSIERLAMKALITESQAQDILRGMSEVVISRGKSGRTIARLANR